MFAAFLAASLGIGIYHSLTGGRQKTTQEFIMADRKLKALPTMISIVASYHSAILILGQTAEMYNWGIQAWVIGGLTGIASGVITERLIVPWIYPLKLTSSFEVNAVTQCDSVSTFFRKVQQSVVLSVDSSLNKRFISCVQRLVVK